MPRFISVSRVDELADGDVRLVEADGTRIALCRFKGQFFALSDFCPHLTGHLSEGTLDGDELVCPEHFWRFKVHSGRCVNVRGNHAHTFPVKIIDDEVYVGV
jgi:nitrite reductase/ring-hydroxylating ferredoxin subunit